MLSDNNEAISASNPPVVTETILFWQVLPSVQFIFRKGLLLGAGLRIGVRFWVHNRGVIGGGLKPNGVGEIGEASRGLGPGLVQLPYYLRQCLMD